MENNVLELLDGIIDSAETATKEAGKKSGGNNFTSKGLGMLYPDMTVGNYEMRPIIDDSGKLFEEVEVHSVKSMDGKKKVSVACTGKGCPVCVQQLKLKELKYGKEFIYKARKYYKVILQIGKITSGEDKFFQPGKVVVANMGKDFYLAFTAAIKAARQYQEADIITMLDSSKVSGGFVVTTAKVGKKHTYNFSFIPQLALPTVDLKVSAEETENNPVNLVTSGNLRATSSDKKKEEANDIMNSVILKATQNKLAKDEAAGIVDPKTEETTASDGTTEVETEPVATTEVGEVVEVVRDPAIFSEDDTTPKCNSWFSPSENVCVAGCPHKNTCLTATIAAGHLG